MEHPAHVPRLVVEDAGRTEVQSALPNDEAASIQSTRGLSAPRPLQRKPSASRISVSTSRPKDAAVADDAKAGEEASVSAPQAGPSESAPTANADPEVRSSQKGCVAKAPKRRSRAQPRRSRVARRGEDESESESGDQVSLSPSSSAPSTVEDASSEEESGETEVNDDTLDAGSDDGQRADRPAEDAASGTQGSIRGADKPQAEASRRSDRAETKQPALSWDDMNEDAPGAASTSAHGSLHSAATPRGRDQGRGRGRGRGRGAPAPSPRPSRGPSWAHDDRYEEAISRERTSRGRGRDGVAPRGRADAPSRGKPRSGSNVRGSGMARSRLLGWDDDEDEVDEDALQGKAVREVPRAARPVVNAWAPGGPRRHLASLLGPEANAAPTSQNSRGPASPDPAGAGRGSQPPSAPRAMRKEPTAGKAKEPAAGAGGMLSVDRALAELEEKANPVREDQGGWEAEQPPGVRPKDRSKVPPSRDKVEEWAERSSPLLKSEQGMPVDPNTIPPSSLSESNDFHFANSDDVTGSNDRRSITSRSEPPSATSSAKGEQPREDPSSAAALEPPRGPRLESQLPSGGPPPDASGAAAWDTPWRHDGFEALQATEALPQPGIRAGVAATRGYRGRGRGGFALRGASVRGGAPFVRGGAQPSAYSGVARGGARFAPPRGPSNWAATPGVASSRAPLSTHSNPAPPTAPRQSPQGLEGVPRGPRAEAQRLAASSTSSQPQVRIPQARYSSRSATTNGPAAAKTPLLDDAPHNKHADTGLPGQMAASRSGSEGHEELPRPTTTTAALPELPQGYAVDATGTMWDLRTNPPLRVGAWQLGSDQGPRKPPGVGPVAPSSVPEKRPSSHARTASKLPADAVRAAAFRPGSASQASSPAPLPAHAMGTAPPSVSSLEQPTPNRGQGRFAQTMQSATPSSLADLMAAAQLDGGFRFSPGARGAAAAASSAQGRFGPSEASAYAGTPPPPPMPVPFEVSQAYAQQYGGYDASGVFYPPPSATRWAAAAPLGADLNGGGATPGEASYEAYAAAAAGAYAFVDDGGHPHHHHPHSHFGAAGGAQGGATSASASASQHAYPYAVADGWTYADAPSSSSQAALHAAAVGYEEPMQWGAVDDETWYAPPPQQLPPTTMMSAQTDLPRTSANASRR